MQVLVNMIDLGANPQAASDAARFWHQQDANVVYLEANLYNLVGKQLEALGHHVEPANGENMGGFQAILLQGDAGLSPRSGSPPSDAPISGVYRAASDDRKDGEAVGW